MPKRTRKTRKVGGKSGTSFQKAVTGAKVGGKRKTIRRKTARKHVGGS
jgi:hypothetical protein